MATIREVQVESARRQSVFRDVNNRIKELVESGTPEFLCECVNIECVELMEVPLDVYERVRSVPTRFLVRPGHVLPDVEHIVESNGTYVVVEKYGAAAPVAAELYGAAGNS
jgi:hypothetical protein